MSKLLVTHCICDAISFEEVKKIAFKEGFTSVSELQSADVCSTNCRMCEPYVEMMLETDRTAFEPGEYLKRCSGFSS
ncbi:MAG: bacterioferritin-associated ferredoxin [Balneola sp.]